MIELFKDYYLKADKFGQTIIKKVYGTHDFKTKEWVNDDSEHLVTINYPHWNNRYSAAIDEYEKDLMKDEELHTFKEQVEHLEQLKVDINNMLQEMNKNLTHKSLKQIK